MIEVRHNQIPKRQFDSGDRRHDMFLAMHFIERETLHEPLDLTAWEVIEVEKPDYPDAA